MKAEQTANRLYITPTRAGKIVERELVPTYSERYALKHICGIDWAEYGQARSLRYIRGVRFTYNKIKLIVDERMSAIEYPHGGTKVFTGKTHVAQLQRELRAALIDHIVLEEIA